jgi:hypothetical protein
LYFSALGYRVNIVEFYIDRQFYDSGLEYDQNPGILVYDSGLLACSSYSLYVSPISEDIEVLEFTAVSQDTKDLITAGALLLEPVGAHLKEIESALSLVDIINKITSDETNIVIS